uniref:Calmodulin-binding protein 60 G n=1 Tax=Noccaea caerulescens TaxID=107243 RepID=A0A1J3CUQ4_NOCCA
MKMRNSPFHGARGYTGLRASNFTFKKAVKKVMRDRSNNQFMVQMENMVRRIFREEFDRRIQPYLSSSWAQMEQPRSETPSSRSRFKLRFINSPPPSIFTGAKIETEDESPVAIELIDVTTNARVVSGPLSSSRLEIVPLNGDFTEERWNVDGFKRNILKQREGKRPLLTGDLTVTLKDGVGVIAGDVSFSDNSSWTRSRKFRLGARLTGGGAVEARSEAFGCKDQRGESYKKHHPPYPGDEVWRLEKIAKDGVSATRLGERKIYTVKDFRRGYAIAPNELYSILGVGTSKRTWEAIVAHAMRCVLDETECYMYNANANGISLLFNSVYEVVKVYFGDGTVGNPDQLPTYQLEQLKLEAYQNLNRFRPFTDPHPQRSLQCTQDPGFGIACPALQHIDFQGNSGPSDSSMSVYFTAASSTVHPEMVMSFDNSPAATFHMDEFFLPSLGNSFRVNEHEPVHGESSRTGVTRGYIEKDEDCVHENTLAYQHHHDTRSNWSPGAADWEQQQMYNSFYFSVSGTEEAGTYDVRIGNTVGSPRARWCKVKAAFKLREVWRHTTARKRGKSCKKPCLPY